MGVATELEHEGAVDEGRATERVLSLVSTPTQEAWMGQYFIRSRRERDGWGHARTRIWYRHGQDIRQAIGDTLEDAIASAQHAQQAGAMIRVHGRLV